MTFRFAVFLDRDGVINRKLPNGRFVCRWDEFEFLPGVPKAIRLLRQNLLTTILVTNQRGVSLGLYSEVELLRLHQRMCSVLRRHRAPLDGIYYCPHPAGVCSCRKPGVALFRRAFQDFPGTSPSTSVVVGDSIGDMQAAHQLGCEKVLIDNGKGVVEEEAQKLGIHIDYCADSLLVAVQKHILPRFAKFHSA